MPTYQAADITKSVPGIDQAAVYFGTINNVVATATGDVLNPCKIAAGIAVVTLVINVRAAFGATAPASMGITHVDGSAVPAIVTAIPVTCVVVAADTTLQTTGTKLLMPSAGPFVTQRDSFLSVVFGAVVTGSAGIADFVVKGEFRGVMS